MRFFFSDRRHPTQAPAPTPPAAQPLPTPAPPPAPRPLPAEVPALTDESILAYLDSCLDGTARHVPRPAQLDLMDRALELTTRDWLEEEAGAELAWLAEYDRPRLESLYHRLVAGLIRNPIPDVVGVRASRIAFSALHHCSSTPDRRVPGRPDRWT